MPTPAAEPTNGGAGDASVGRFPDFFVVGHHKCGTTALWHSLRAHPQIYMPNLKEPQFLAEDMRRRFEPPQGRVLARLLPQTREEYLALFADAAPEQLAGEASASYLWSRTAATRIAEARPGARMVAILREPASFLRSLHLQLYRSHIEDEPDLRKAMSLEAARRRGKHIPRRSHLPQQLQYSGHVSYVEQLERYRAHFPREQMLALIYDDFRAANEDTVREVLRFLGVDADGPVEIADENTTSRNVRSQQVDDLVDAMHLGRNPAARATRGAVKTLTSRRLRHGAFRLLRRRYLYTEPPPPDEAFMLDLRRRYKGEVVALSEYLGRDLVSLWGYDKLG
jgi:hypothetical protein